MGCRLERFGSPRTTAVDRRSDTIRSGGPTRSSADVSVPRQRFYAALGFPLITLITLYLLTSQPVPCLSP